MTEPAAPPPVDTPKHARSMTEDERKAKLDEIIRQGRQREAPPVAAPSAQHCRDWSESERAVWLREHKRRWR